MDPHTTCAPTRVLNPTRWPQGQVSHGHVIMHRRSRQDKLCRSSQCKGSWLWGPEPRRFEVSRAHTNPVSTNVQCQSDGLLSHACTCLVHKRELCNHQCRPLLHQFNSVYLYGLHHCDSFSNSAANLRLICLRSWRGRTGSQLS